MARMGRRPNLQPRVLGPYRHHGGWRVIVVGDDGRRRLSYFDEYSDAEQFIAIVTAKISDIVHTTDTARRAWLEDLGRRGLSPRTIEGYDWAVNTFWPDARPLRALSTEGCAERYRMLTASLSVDSHRNALKMCKTFLRWCEGRGWIRGNPLDGVDGIGRRKRGKPQLRLSEARALYAHAMQRAGAGDDGAIAVLMCLLLTMRSESEVLRTVARDLDDDARILWIDRAKTEAGQRQIQIPEDIRPALLELAKGKAPSDPLFRRRDRKWLWDAAARLCAEAGVPRIPPHGLRGLHATLAKQAGATSHLVAAALGHASPRVTEEHYIDQEAARSADQRRGLVMLKGGRE